MRKFLDIEQLHSAWVADAASFHSGWVSNRPGLSACVGIIQF